LAKCNHDETGRAKEVFNYTVSLPHHLLPVAIQSMDVSFVHNLAHRFKMVAAIQTQQRTQKPAAAQCRSFAGEFSSAFKRISDDTYVSYEVTQIMFMRK
jgi:flagellar hook-basal body complex protein FliE